MHWASDLPAPFAEMKKNFSILIGHGIKPDLQWDTYLLQFASGNARVRRASLHNYGNARVVVDTVQIIGPDTSEFHIIANQNNFTPINPMTTPFLVDPQGEASFDTTQWVDIQFTPDTTILRDRIDTIVAIDDQGIHHALTLVGIIGDLSVTQESASTAGELRLVPFGDQLDILIPPEFGQGAHLAIFDALGRELRAFESKSQTESLDVADLSSGTYYLRASKGNIVKTAVFIIAH